MHQQCYAFVEGVVERHGPYPSVIEIGSLHINGSVRPLFAATEHYTGVDPQPGRDVDVVADARDYVPAEPVDCVVCVNVLEHVQDKRGVVEAAHRMLKPGGAFIMTAATDPWKPHSATDGGAVRPGEYYGNVDMDKATAHLRSLFNRTEIRHDAALGEIYVVAWR